MAALREGLDFGIEHAAGLAVVSHQCKGHAVLGIHSGMEGVLLDGVVKALGIRCGKGIERAIGASGLVVETFGPRHADILPGASRDGCYKGSQDK